MPKRNTAIGNVSRQCQCSKIEYGVIEGEMRQVCRQQAPQFALSDGCAVVAQQVGKRFTGETDPQSSSGQNDPNPITAHLHPFLC